MFSIFSYYSVLEPGGSYVTMSYDKNISNELSSIGDSLIRISRKLHTHVHKLEIAVEGEYAGDTSDPRVRLLNEALNTSRSADIELGRLNQAMQRAVFLLQGQATGTI